MTLRRMGIVFAFCLVPFAFFPPLLAGVNITERDEANVTSPRCDQLALRAGFDAATDYFCPGERATLNVETVERVRKGVWLGPSVAGVLLLTEAHVTTDDPELLRMTEKPIDLGVISLLDDEHDALRFLESNSGTTAESNATAAVRLRDCACAGCRTPDSISARCIRAGCRSWCCVCIVNEV